MSDADKSINELFKELEQLRAKVDMMEPVFLWVGVLVEKWAIYEDRLSEKEKELLRLHRRAMKGAENAGEGIGCTDNSNVPTDNIICGTGTSTTETGDPTTADSDSSGTDPAGNSTDGYAIYNGNGEIIKIINL